MIKIFYYYNSGIAVDRIYLKFQIIRLLEESFLLSVKLKKKLFPLLLEIDRNLMTSTCQKVKVQLNVRTKFRRHTAMINFISSSLICQYRMEI